jgi:uncharacterized membrane protein (UPF0136 family)
MSGVSMLGGVMAYTMAGSVPSLVACMGISGLMAMSSMRIRDGLQYGNEAAAGELSHILHLYQHLLLPSNKCNVSLEYWADNKWDQ